MRIVSLLMAISVWSGIALAQRAAQPVSSGRTVYLPVVTLASTETAQVNVVNLASGSSTSMGEPSGNSNPSCAGSIAFYNASGNALNVTSTTSFTITAGQIFSVTVPYSETAPANSTSTARTPVRAVVSLNQPGGSPMACSLAANVEVFDTATGVTHVHVEGNTPFVGLAGLFQNR